MRLLDARALLTSGLICLFGLLVTVLGFWPGTMPFDAICQYCQATTHSYNTWHPVTMAAWWSLLDALYPGPALMLLFHLILYWGALLLLAHALQRLALSGAWSVCLLGFAPFLLNFAGTILKDTGLLVSWAFAFALVFRAYVQNSRLGLLGAALVFVLLAYGISVRVNAAFALFPLLGLFMQTWPGAQWKRILSVAFIAAAIFMVGPIVDHCTDAKKRSTFSAALLYDIVGIAVRRGEEVLPEYVRVHPQYSWNTIYSSYTTDDVAPLIVDRHKRQRENKDIKWWAEGPRLNTPLSVNIDAHVQEIRRAWFAAVVNNPCAYVEHRIAVLRSFLRFGVATPYCAYLTSSPFSASFEWTSKPNYLGTAIPLGIRGFIVLVPVLFKPYLWLALAILWFAVLLKYQGNHVVRVAAMTLISSAILYMLPYSVVSQAADCRYIYWTVWAVATASMMLLLDMIHRRSLGYHRGRFMVGMAVLASLLLADVLLTHGVLV